MGIYDREYIRGGPRSSSGFGAVKMWSVNTWIIVINVAVFVLDAMLASSGVAVRVDMGSVFRENTPVAVQREVVPQVDGQGREVIRQSNQFPGSLRVDLIDPQTREVVGQKRYDLMPPLEALFHFSTGKGFFGLEVWRLVGFQFLHGSPMHLFLNMLGLYFFGGLVENYLGGKRYLAFYLTCGVFGGLTYLLLNLLGFLLPFAVPGLLIHDIYIPLIGASAGVFGVLMAAAFVAPNAMVLFMFVFPMKLWQLAYGFVILSAINLLMSGQNAGGDAAHIGGALAGWYFIRHTHLLRDFFDFFDFFSPRKKGPKRSKRPARTSFQGRSTPNDSEVDRILSKVATQGLHSLTNAEKRTLRQATESKKR